ncbi:purine and uridine phosphorylase [Aspergillus vadensis CBS 113365]|uniref:Purine and uridine phosphorylase n=1 Tax=Aspergillus vadensis (strain CBS 113365 / IMI 142717 / IBT 24658) TaxID=1448311 RepID=A0A319B4L5_ASPVC|nr:purine and uridine phosphorylase [Aspergillus vadensis CBS 113365]PYH67355.1 purine and uridine phosphorylase [Aspergillus vadensis CBS 113365]
MTVVTRPPPDRHGFKIAIVCALPREADAVIALLDHHWEDTEEVYSKVPGDPNAYTTGVMGTHNVVVAHMPHTGKVSAAGVAMGLRTTFPSIDLALLVGICGGVPSDPNRQRDIFLGDVIFSQAMAEYDSGRQYQSGKQADGEEVGGGIPSLSIQSILRKLETDRHLQHLEEEAKIWLQTLQHRPKYQYPGRESDRLFQPSYLHRHREPSTCGECSDENVCADAFKASCSDLGCDEDNIVRRERTVMCPQTPDGSERTETGPWPAIHVGRMGLSSAAMESGKQRDELAQREGIIGLEIEGAGVCSLFPSLVIKGVCDYADSHRNEDWQDYAAATAAACTKAFLQHWATDAMSTIVELGDIMTMVQSGDLLQDQGKPAAAAVVFRKALKRMQDSEATGSLMEIDIIMGLTQALVTLNRHAEAEPLLVQLVKSCIRQVGDQESTLAAMRNLAEFYEEWDMCLAAQPLRTKVAQINQRRLGRGSVPACLSQYEVGLNLIRQGRHAEARPSLYTNLEYPLEAEDVSHKGNLDRMVNIAGRLADCGIDRCEYLHVAEHMARDAVRLVRPRIEMLPYVALSAFRILGFVYRLLGKAAEAEEQYLEALTIVNGRSQMEWLESDMMVRCSSVSLEQGRYSPALSMASEALGKVQRQEEPLEDTLARCRTNLALACINMGQYRSAGSLVVDILSKAYEDAWDIGKSTVSSLLGTVSIIEDVATVLSRAGCWQQSQHIYENTHSILAQLLGTMDMRTLRTSLRLRDTLSLQGNFMDALVLSLECKDRYLQRVRQDTVPERMMMAQLDIGLARAYEGLGDHTTAEALARQALKTITESTDENSPESLRAMAILGSILVSQGGPKLMKGSAMQRRVVETWATLTEENSLPTLEAIEAVARTCEIQGDKEQLKVWRERASSVKETFEESLSEEEEDRIEYLVGQVFEKWAENGEKVIQEIDRRRTKVFTMMLP